MKPSPIIPVATAIIGFGIAWLVKPSGGPTLIHDPAPAPEMKTERPARADGDGRPSASAGKRPAEVKAGDFPLADQYEKGPKTREEAKMLRLTEALGLSIDQQGSILALIEKVQASTSTTAPVLEDLTARGKAVEEGLQKVLTPEQMAKFQEIRDRERENRNEVRAQQMLVSALQEIDVSPGQREELLARLREKSKRDLQSIPASATLLLDKSLLPTGGKELSAEGVLLLAKMGEPIEVGDPVEAQKKVIEKSRGELEEVLQCFDGILTQGQMGQYQAGLAEQKAQLNRLPTEPVKIDPATLTPPPERLPEILPDDPEEVSDADEPAGK